MMKIFNHDLEKMRTAFVTLSRLRESPDLDESWQKGVMNHLRTLERQGFQNGSEERFQRIAWRLIPAACLMIFILGFILIKVDFFPEYEMARQFIEDPTGYVVTKILGV